MKKITLALGSSLTLLFLVSACTDTAAPSTSTPKTNTTQTGTTVEQKKNDQSAALTVGKSEQAISQDQNETVTSQQEVLSLNEEEKVNQEKAIQYMDLALCDKLTTQEKKVVCKQEVEAAKQAKSGGGLPTDEENEIYAKALQEKNVKLCEEIKDADLKTSCEINILKKN
ncbi:hypothetical protein IT413_03620 [Candidatus Peregrinibacteria bacterium]|nr:hypothetical protein [Candidatus Peregrinibacteria bacterium]